MSKESNPPATKADINRVMERFDQLATQVTQLSITVNQLSENTERWKNETIEEVKRHFDISRESIEYNFNGAFGDTLSLFENRHKRFERRLVRLEHTVKSLI